MPRSGALLLSLMAVVGAGCSPAPEEPILNQFFAASRLHDTTMLAELATVEFGPTTHGIVTTFTITKVVPVKRGGEIVSKDVTIDAPVKLPNGEVARKTLVVTIQRPEPTGGVAARSRWIVTAIKDASAAAATRRS